jgi:hypothetical protein
MVGYPSLQLDGAEPSPALDDPLIGAFITLGRGREFGITDQADGSQRLVIREITGAKVTQSIDLGPATKARINAICSYLLQLRTFCP